MDKQYKNSLDVAKSCNEKDIKNLSQLIEKTKSEDLKKDLERLNKFIKYAKTDDSNKYLNPFEVLNVNEDSMSELIAWLLDQTKNEVLDEKIQNIKQDFCKKFMKKIGLENIENLSCELRKSTEKQAKKPDIIIKNDNDIICIIENKKNAKLSCTKDYKDDEKIKTQLEHYKNSYPNAKKYIFLVDPTSNYLDSKIETHIREYTHCLDEEYDKIKDKEFIYLLNKLEYEPLEHDFVVLTLYETLKEYYKEAFIDEDSYILKTTSYDRMENCLKALLSLYGNNIQKELERVITTLKQYDNPNEITFEKLKKDYPSLKGELKKIGKNAISFHANSNNFKENILEILCQYIEYWELHSSIGNGKDNLCGLTKIIDGEFIFNSCDRIRRNEVFGKLPQNVKAVICNMICNLAT